jgi:hypothetical protein
MNKLEHSIREFSPIDGDWRPLDALFDQVFASPDAVGYYDAIFNLFERFPYEDGAGVFWSAVHGMEARGGYEKKLLSYFRRWPGTMTTAMLRRIYNSGQELIESFPIERLIDIKRKK